MKYKDYLMDYHKDELDKTIYIFKSKTPKEFSKKYIKLIGFIDEFPVYIKTITGNLFMLRDFKKVRKATRKDINSMLLGKF